MKGKDKSSCFCMACHRGHIYGEMSFHIPHLSQNARCIAVDLIGCGRSDPDIEFSVEDHIRYVNGFIEHMGLKDILFVAHSWGSTFALHYASQHESNVKGFAFIEPMLMPFATWEEFNPSRPQAAETFKKFRPPELGWDLIVNQNVFADRIGESGYLRKLTDQEKAFYREPFDAPRSRLPLWRSPQELPIAGSPVNVIKIVENYNPLCQESCRL